MDIQSMDTRRRTSSRLTLRHQHSVEQHALVRVNGTDGEHVRGSQDPHVRPSGFDAWLEQRERASAGETTSSSKPLPAVDSSQGSAHSLEAAAEEKAEPQRESGTSSGEPAQEVTGAWIPAPQDPPRVGAREGSAPKRKTGGKTKKPRPSRVPRPPLKVRAMVSIDRFIDATSDPRRLTAVEQLREGPPTDRLMGWMVTVVITVIAFFIRWWKIGEPADIMFDETYYAKDAWSLLQYGYEGSWHGKSDIVNASFAAGDASALTSHPSFIVHPELGKWLIASGEWLFGLNSFGWRFGSLVFGTLLVFMVIRLARRLSRSTLIGGLAGILIAVDGLSFVMSRIALLDIFQAFFIVAGVACVVADRDHFRHKLADALERTPAHSFEGKAGPFVFRPWLVLAGVMFGMACATKWNSIYSVAVFGVVVVVWSMSARRLAGARRGMWWSLLKDGVPAFVSMVVVGAGVYLSTWVPWLMTSGGYDRDWGSKNPDDWVVGHFGEGLGSLWHYHVDMYNWHTGETMAHAVHSYSSSPWGWPVAARTIGIYADNGIRPGGQVGDAVCKLVNKLVDTGETECVMGAAKTGMKVVTGLGTPFLWWAAALAVLAALVWWLVGMDWRFAVPVLAMGSTWIPWMFVGTRPLFNFYAITITPFMVIALAMALGVALGKANAGLRRQNGAIGVGTIVGLIILNFAFNYPIYTGKFMDRSHWLLRMWLPGWV